MNIRKGIGCLLLAAALCASASAETLRVYTPFAEMDAAAQGYEDLLMAWQEETGNVAEDFSGAQDEAWLQALRQAVSAGQADLVVLPVGANVSGLVPAQTLLTAAPDCDARAMDAFREADGQTLLSPVRLHWESLYVNEDVLAAFGLGLPGSWDELVVDCAILSQAGVTPLANALCEWAEIALDCAALMAEPAGAYGGEASRAGAGEVLATLVQVGGFGADPWNASDEAMEQAFLAGQAAMRLDAADLAQRVPEERQDAVRVLFLPGRDGEARRTLPGTAAYGLALTEACWQSPSRREAALSLASRMLSRQGLAALSGLSGALGESVAALTAEAEDMTGLLYDLNPQGFDDWAEATVASLMSAN